jgi:hypothetical protein
MRYTTRTGDMQRWEYLILGQDMVGGKPKARWANRQEIRDWKNVDFSDYINSLGDQGWELVAVQAFGFYFKRPKALM